MDTGTLTILLLFGIIPLLVFGVAGFSQWLKFKERQQALGTSTHELEAAVERLQADRAALRRRIETLEAIVTSEEWEAQGTALPSKRAALSPPPEGDEPERAGEAPSRRRPLRS